MMIFKILIKILRKLVFKMRRLIKEEQKRIEEEQQQVSDEQKYSNYQTKYPLLCARFNRIDSQTNHERPAYVWGVLCGVDLAKELGIPRVSVIEFGVAEGNGLVRLEEIALKVEKIYGLEVDIYGFDSGFGLPKPEDYRDMPYLWDEGYFPMDKEKLQKRLQKAKLILGPVKDTITEFINLKPSPIVFMAFDLDFYSSTTQCFKLLDADPNLFLPRTHCYFDDTMGFSFGDFNGERLAIADFNKSHNERKISLIHGLKYRLGVFTSPWVEQMYMFHIFNHASGNKNDGMYQSKRLPL